MKLLSKLCTIFYLVKDPLAAIGRSIYRSGIGLTNIQCLQMCDQCKIIHFHFHDNDRDNDDENDNDSDNDDDDDEVTYLSTLPAVVGVGVVVTPWMHSAVHWAPPPNFFLSVMNITCKQTNY